jgi:iron complex transport system substrate-binding protein
VDIASEAGVPGSRPVNAEALVKADPDLFLLMSHGLTSIGGVDGLEDMAGIAETDAGRNKCVVDMIDYQVLSFGPQFPATLDALATAIYAKAAPQ